MNLLNVFHKLPSAFQQSRASHMKKDENYFSDFELESVRKKSSQQQLVALLTTH